MKFYLSLFLGLMVYLAQAGTAWGATLEDYLRTAPLVDIQISPDGKHLAMLRREEKDTLYVVTRADNSVVTGVSSSAGQRFHSFRWANDNRLLIEPAIEVRHSARALPTGELLAYSIDGAKNGYLRRSKFAGGAQMYALVNLLPDDPDHVLVARYQFSGAQETSTAFVRRQDALGLTAHVVPVLKQDDAYRAVACADDCALDESSLPTLERMNIYTGATEIVVKAPSGQGEFIADASGDQVLFTGLDSGLVSIYKIEAGADWDEIKYFTRYYDLGASPIGFDSMGNVIALDNLVDTLGLSKLSDSGEVQSIFRDSAADIDRLVRARDGSFLAASFSAGFPSWYYHLPNSNFAKTHKALRVAYPESDIAVTSFTDGQREAIVRVYSDKNPGTYYAVNLETRKAEDLLRRIDWLEEDDLVDTQPFQFATRDKFEVYGYITLPKNTDSTPPVIVMTQPYPFSEKFQWGYDARTQLLANAGYAVLQVNTRGAPGYGLSYTVGSDTELDLWTDNDLVDAIRWAGQQELIDPGRVCLFGAERGAYSALLTAMRNPDEFRCVVAADGEYRLSDLQGDANPARPFAASLLTNRDITTPPWLNELVSDADRLRTPTLIISEAQSEVVGQLLEKSQQEFARHVIGVTSLNRVSQTQSLVKTYKRILEFIKDAFSADLRNKDLNRALHTLLSPEEKAALQKIMNKVYRDIQRTIRDRDSRNLPTAFERRPVDRAEKSRRAARAISGRDKEVKKVLPEEYWQAYESFKQSYESRVAQSIRRGSDIPEYTLPGAAGR